MSNPFDDFDDGVTQEELELDYDVNETRIDYINRMKAEDKRIILPNDNELLIDIDCEEHYENFQKGLACLQRNEVFDFTMEEKESDSGYPNRHITITLPFKLEPWQRIAFQAALGSDPIRELLSSIRLYRGDEHPTLFVEDEK